MNTNFLFVLSCLQHAERKWVFNVLESGIVFFRCGLNFLQIRFFLKYNQLLWNTMLLLFECIQYMYVADSSGSLLVFFYSVKTDVPFPQGTDATCRSWRANCRFCTAGGDTWKLLRGTAAPEWAVLSDLSRWVCIMELTLTVNQVISLARLHLSQCRSVAVCSMWVWKAQQMLWCCFNLSFLYYLYKPKQPLS